MKSLFVLLAALIVLTGCSVEKREPIISIVNMGSCDRIELGKMIKTIQQYKPLIIAMDFFLVPDSADRDTVLVTALERIRNTVQIVGLHDVVDYDDVWDSLETNHPKFRVANHGFANLQGDGRYLEKRVSLKQTFDSEPVFAFSYVVAQNTFGVKEKFRDPDEELVEFEMERIGKNYILVQKEDLLSGKITRSDIEGKIVILGYIGKKEDLVWVHGEDQTFNGVEVHAAIIEELLDR